MNRKIKVISDGTTRNTKLVFADTGKDLGVPVTGIEWSINVDTGMGEARIEVLLAGAEIEVEGARLEAFITKIKPKRARKRTQRR